MEIPTHLSLYYNEEQIEGYGLQKEEAQTLQKALKIQASFSLSLSLPQYCMFGCARKCHIIQMSYFVEHDNLASNVVLRSFFKKMVYFNVEVILYKMMMHKYERTFLSKKYSHNVTQYGVIKKYRLMMMSSPYHTLRI